MVGILVIVCKQKKEVLEDPGNDNAILDGNVNLEANDDANADDQAL